jgi:UDP-N-acetylglucosamine 2-epimerase (non-hydrolysing)
MEAGNRCFDDRVPEEINRRVIDHASSVLLPYTERSRDNLLHEGIPTSRVIVTGNPIKQVIDRYAKQIADSQALKTHGLRPGAFFLVTMHRSENVDREDRLRSIVGALHRLANDHGKPVLCSVHPRTRARAEQFGIDIRGGGQVRFVEPLGFFDFIHLEQRAFCVLSDSGTVQEEACLFGVPAVTIRDVTERPETVECGSNYLAGTDPDSICRGVATVTGARFRWTPPPEYLRPNVAEIVCHIVTSHRVPDLAEADWQSGAR